MPTPFPPADWPESPASNHPSYTPTFDPLPEPVYTLIDPVANGQALNAATAAANAAAAVVDSEAGKTGVVVGAATATLEAAAGKMQLGALQLAIARTADSASQPVTIQAEVLPAEQAQNLSPVGMAFKLQINQPDGVNASAIDQGLQLTLDYRQIPMRYGGSFRDRLALYRVHPCPPRQTTDEEIQAGAISNEPCQTWEVLPGFNDTINQQLVIDLHATPVVSPVVSPTIGEDALPAVAPPTVDPQQTNQLYLPLAANGQAANRIDADEFYVLAATASSQQGNYAATPLATLGDYQVSLASGSAQTSYPVPLPPAAAGLAPAVTLIYDSGTVDGMTSNKNNQPRP